MRKDARHTQASMRRIFRLSLANANGARPVRVAETGRVCLRLINAADSPAVSSEQLHPAMRGGRHHLRRAAADFTLLGKSKNRRLKNMHQPHLAGPKR